MVVTPYMPVTDLKINSHRLKSDLEALAQIGATQAGGVSRPALSNEDLEARAWFANQIEDAGLFVRDDEVGNLSGVLPCPLPNAPTLLVGSHLDTVPNGGIYDGALGVLAGLECLRTIKECGIALPCNLEVINFTDEEGWWQSFFGSLGLSGALEPHHISDAQQDNAAFRAALYRAGIRVSEVHRARRKPESLLGYLELHIEQSSRLERAGIPIGVVSGVVGRSTYIYTFYGEGTHAATTATEERRDALQGAAAFILQMYEMSQRDYPEGVVNCGNIVVEPGTFNVIPALSSLRVECRHHDRQILAEMEARLVRLAQDIAREYRLSVNVQQVIRRDVAIMDEGYMQTIETVCNDLGLKHKRLVSYAGHDAQILSPITPTAMIFIPSRDGISHNPKEYSTWEDIENGANVLLHTMLRVAQGHITD